MPASQPAIARLRITLDEVTPTVFRRIEVPLGLCLDDLHLVIQAAMGWENGHLYEFRSGHAAWGILDEDPGWRLGDGPRAAHNATLAELIGQAKRKSFKYLYDFGDDWEHTVTVEKLAEADPAARYPRLLAAKGACPPEDCGGPWGYADYLDAICNPAHANHREMINWRGPGFDPDDANETGIRKHLDRLAASLGTRQAQRARARGTAKAAGAV